MLDESNVQLTDAMNWVYYTSGSKKETHLVRAWQKAALKQVAKHEPLEVFFIKLARTIFGYDKQFLFVNLKHPLQAIAGFRTLLKPIGYTVYLEKSDEIIDDDDSTFQDPPPITDWEEKIVAFILQKMEIQSFFKETRNLVCGVHQRILMVNPKDPIEAVSRFNNEILKDTPYHVRLTTDSGQSYLKAV